MPTILERTQTKSMNVLRQVHSLDDSARQRHLPCAHEGLVNQGCCRRYRFTAWLFTSLLALIWHHPAHGQQPPPKTQGPAASAASAAAQEAQLSLLAEQAFVSLDFARAYKLASQALSINPKNLTTRRLAARSALALKKTSQCQRLLLAVSPQLASSDDIHTLGECSEGSSNISEPVVRYIERARKSTDKTDAASFWLGTFAYQKEQYAKASTYLDAVLVLPARFEEKKRFMQDRIADYLKIQENRRRLQKKTPESEAEKNRGIETQAPPGAVADTEKKLPKREKDVPEKPRSPQPPALKNGPFYSFAGDASAGLAGGVQDTVSTETGDQEAFDRELRAAAREGRNPNLSTIREESGSLLFPTVRGVAHFQTGYRAGNFVEKDGTEYAGGLLINVAYSGIKVPFYTLKDTRAHPSSSALHNPSGAGARLHGRIDFQPNPFFSIKSQLYIDRLISAYDVQYGQTGGDTEVRLSSGSFYLALRGFWSFLQGEDLAMGGDWNGFELDAGLIDLGFFSIQAPRGHALFAYQVSAARNDSPTTGVHQVVATEGEFFEFNFAPAFTFLDRFKAMFWYRYVTGTGRSYRSSVTRSEQDKSGDLRAKFPDAEYESQLSDWYAAIEYNPWAWGGIVAGLGASFYTTVFTEETAIATAPNAVTTYSYQPLLDAGKRNLTFGFVEFQARF